MTYVGKRDQSIGEWAARVLAAQQHPGWALTKAGY
jgi:hypothetical protein